MTRPAEILVSVIGLTIVLAAPADAGYSRNHHKHVAASTGGALHPRERGTNLFPPGPVMYGQQYLGDDPDPFIRSQILRDLPAHFGGGNN